LGGVHGHELGVVHLGHERGVRVLAGVAEHFAFLLLEFDEAGRNDREVLGADAVELVHDAEDLRLLNAQHEDLDELERDVLAAVEDHGHAADQAGELFDGLRLARAAVALEPDALVQLQGHADVEPTLLSQGRDDQALRDAVLLPALADVEVAVEHVESDFVAVFVVLLELEDGVPLPGLLRGDVGFAEVLHPEQRGQNLGGLLLEVGLRLDDVLELLDGVDDQHDLLVLLGLLLVVFDCARLELLAEGDEDAHEDQLDGLGLHPLLEGVDEVAALVAALDLVFDVGLLLALLGQERGQLHLQVAFDGFLKLLEPVLDVLVRLEFDQVFLKIQVRSSEFLQHCEVTLWIFLRFCSSRIFMRSTPLKSLLIYFWICLGLLD